MADVLITIGMACISAAILTERLRCPTAFTPVELLLAAIAGCTAVDVDVVTGRRSPADTFGATITANYLRDDSGNRLDDIQLSFQVSFPDGAAGDAARAILPKVLKTSHDRTCTVSRTIESGTPITVSITPAEGAGTEPDVSVDPATADQPQ